ncbi:MAG TPA: phosphoenolpyruvate--protein phosphotransferase [Verrucomicrobiae bacterium]|nr:phosphoenolpyruvate--protein phosphotransferase [Verrucomicrobiae bacterium]
MLLPMPDNPQSGERIFHGIAVSPGVCQGRVIVLGKAHAATARQQIPDSQVPQEVHRFKQALVQTRQQILDVQRRLTEKMGTEHAGIFEAHLLVLDDPEVNNEVLNLIQNEKANADYAYQTIAERYAASLAAVDDEYLRERAADMRDIAARVLNNLLGNGDEGDLRHLLKEPCIVVAHDLAPSQTAQMERDKVLGFATDVGSRTSHTAIMARSMRIPAVVGFKSITATLETGDYVLLDGVNGLIIVNPTDQTLFEYGQIARRQKSLQERLRDNLRKPAVTLDGHLVTLSGNIENPDDSAAILESGAEGVGLFRTEYLFINKEQPPSEQEQYESYQAVAAALKPAPVVIRTLDLGGDKFHSHTDVPDEMNPFLGWRAIRFCLEEKDVFRAQLRAILRAGAHGNIKMMYPMVSGLDELTQANALLEECKAQLRAEKLPFDDQLEIGIMVETPSAAVIADTLARRVKFFSLGTNDLIQYSLAVDRTNEKIAHLYEPTHPAIVRLIKLTVDAAHQAGIWTGVCGEMAGDPVLVPLLLGLGVDELSAAPPTVPQIKFLIRRLKISEARELAAFALQCESAAEILRRCQALAHQSAPELFLE